MKELNEEMRRAELAERRADEAERRAEAAEWRVAELQTCLDHLEANAEQANYYSEQVEAELREQLVAAEQRAEQAIEECREVEQILGRALGYPAYAADPATFPSATQASGVCVGDHTAASLAQEAAQRLRAAELTPEERAAWQRAVDLALEGQCRARQQGRELGPFVVAILAVDRFLRALAQQTADAEPNFVASKDTHAREPGESTRSGGLRGACR